jgi:hypothetical protein
VNVSQYGMSMVQSFTNEVSQNVRFCLSEYSQAPTKPWFDAKCSRRHPWHMHMPPSTGRKLSRQR